VNGELLALNKFVNLAGTVLESNITSLKRPYKLNYSVTLFCQSRCLTCDIWKLRPKDELTIDEIRKFAKKNNYFKWIELTGGEPFLRSDIVEIAKAFVENCKYLYAITMPTNSLCNYETVLARIRSIAALGTPKFAITISLDGYKELHDKIRGIPGNYEKAVKLFKAIRELRHEYPNIYVIFGYTISKFNEGQFEKTFQSVKIEVPDLTYNDFHINLSQVSTNYYHNENLVFTPQSIPAADEIKAIITHRRPDISIIGMIESAFLRKLEYFARTGRMPLGSRSLEASLFMDGWGNIYPSIMWDKKIGSIKEIDYDLSKVWDSKDAQEVRKAIREHKEPVEWTSCEAFQAILGNMPSIFV
jgi:MoaA/NifB/PqqE/SkfB family radical SAM enzyme